MLMAFSPKSARASFYIPTIKAPLTRPSEILEKPYTKANSLQKSYSVQRAPSLPAISTKRTTVSRPGKLIPKKPSDLSIASQTSKKHFLSSDNLLIID